MPPKKILTVSILYTIIQNINSEQNAHHKWRYNMKDLKVIETKGVRVLTTKQLADAYETTADIVGYNFRYNKKRYVEGKHYILLEGQELKNFKNANVEIQRSLPKINKLYLWTEKGALLHAKSLNTDKAWEVYDYLVDFYFRTKEKQIELKCIPVCTPKVTKTTVVDVPENPKILNAIGKIQEDLICMKILLEDCKRYLSKEVYEERCKAAENVIHILIGDLSRLFEIKPNLIQKPY